MFNSTNFRPWRCARSRISQVLPTFLAPRTTSGLRSMSLIQLSRKTDTARFMTPRFSTPPSSRIRNNTKYSTQNVNNNTLLLRNCGYGATGQRSRRSRCTYWPVFDSTAGPTGPLTCAPRPAGRSRRSSSHYGDTNALTGTLQTAFCHF